MFAQDKFNKDIENHKVNIIKDDGLHRHLYCSSGSLTQHFNVVTFPGYLVYTGDMGTFVFQRVADMFQLFRGATDVGYVASKIEAGKSKEFCDDLAKKEIAEYLDNTLTEECLELDWERWSEARRNEFGEPMPLDEYVEIITQEVTEEVLEGDLSEHYWYHTLNNFMSDTDPDIELFVDWPEGGIGERLSYRLNWAVAAIKWAINEYDKETA